MIYLNDIVLMNDDHTTKLDGIAWQNYPGLTAHAFAFRLLSSIELYGLETDGGIRVLGAHNVRTNNTPRNDIRNLVNFAAKNHLILIDWCRMTAVEPIEEKYQAYFQEQ